MGVIEGGWFEPGFDRNRTSQIIHVEAEAGALQDGIDKAVDDNGDIIVVAPGSHNETAQVDFNKQGITVVAAKLGFAPDVQGERFMVNAAASLDTGSVAKITKTCRIIGLGFASRDLTAENLLIDSEEAGGFSAGFCELVGCRFPTWYGAVDVGVRCLGGQENAIRRCSFDGLFGGFGTGGIEVADSGSITAGGLRVEECWFSGIGAKHAIVHEAASTPLSVLYKGNYLAPGFLGNEGKFLDNNNVASTGLVADNWVAPNANKAAAFENLTNSELAFAGNHYEE